MPANDLLDSLGAAVAEAGDDQAPIHIRARMLCKRVVKKIDHEILFTEKKPNLALLQKQYDFESANPTNLPDPAWDDFHRLLEEPGQREDVEKLVPRAFKNRKLRVMDQLFKGCVQTYDHRKPVERELEKCLDIIELTREIEKVLPCKEDESRDDCVLRRGKVKHESLVMFLNKDWIPEFVKKQNWWWLSFTWLFKNLFKVAKKSFVGGVKGIKDTFKFGKLFVFGERAFQVGWMLLYILGTPALAINFVSNVLQKWEMGFKYSNCHLGMGTKIAGTNIKIPWFYTIYYSCKMTQWWFYFTMLVLLPLFISICKNCAATSFFIPKPTAGWCGCSWMQHAFSGICHAFLGPLFNAASEKNPDRVPLIYGLLNWNFEWTWDSKFPTMDNKKDAMGGAILMRVMDILSHAILKPGCILGSTYATWKALGWALRFLVVMLLVEFVLGNVLYMLYSLFFT